jgi:hypothetical protein
MQEHLERFASLPDGGGCLLGFIDNKLPGDLGALGNGLPSHGGFMFGKHSDVLGCVYHFLEEAFGVLLLHLLL